MRAQAAQTPLEASNPSRREREKPSPIPTIPSTTEPTM